MRNIYLVGAGQLGSRHLQALKKVKYPLNIFVIDPNAGSLDTAKQRYDSVSDGQSGHKITFTTRIPQSADRIDLAIVATSSNVRKTVITELLEGRRVDYMFLEKLLFQQPDDYDAIGALFAKTGTKAWVNCSMRTMPFYRAARREVAGKPIYYHVSGSQFGLVTNAIHYLDHIAFLTGTREYSLDTSLLEPRPIPSKRKGFLELNGTLTARFADGSLGVFTCYPAGDAPVQVQIFGQTVRMIVREAEGKAWVAREGDGWRYSEVDASIPYQSEMTVGIVESILADGNCELVPYTDSKTIHLNLLEPLKAFINDHAEVKSELYPFT